MLPNLSPEATLADLLVSAGIGVALLLVVMALLRRGAAGRQAAAAREPSVAEVG